MPSWVYNNKNTAAAARIKPIGERLINEFNRRSDDRIPSRCSSVQTAMYSGKQHKFCCSRSHHLCALNKPLHSIAYDLHSTTNERIVFFSCAIIDSLLLYNFHTILSVFYTFEWNVELILGDSTMATCSDCLYFVIAFHRSGEIFMSRDSQLLISFYTFTHWWTHHKVVIGYRDTFEKRNGERLHAFDF